MDTPKVKGWLVTIEWTMHDTSSYQRMVTHFTTLKPGRFYVKTRTEYPSDCGALACAVPVEVTEDEGDMLS